MRLAEMDMSRRQLWMLMGKELSCNTINTIADGNAPYSIVPLIKIADAISLEVSLRKPLKGHKDINP